MQRMIHGLSWKAWEKSTTRKLGMHEGRVPTRLRRCTRHTWLTCARPRGRLWTPRARTWRPPLSTPL